MKNNFKRVFALLLAVVMCMTCTLPVFATNGETGTCPEAGVAAKHTKNNCDAIEIDTVDPACETTGYTVYQCNVCKVYFMDDIVKAIDGCQWGPEVRVEPDCENDGSVTKHCSVHNFDKVTTLPATGHNMSGWTPDGAICTEGGATESQYCLNGCGKTETRPATPGDHVWGAPVFETIPTCSTPGKAIYTCTACGVATKEVEVKPMVGDSANHDYDMVNATPVATATCKIEGQVSATCKICGYVGTINTGKAPHQYTVDVEAKAATCTEEGYDAHKKCAVCGEAETGYATYPVIPHSYTIFVSRTEPVCGENGLEVKKCSICNEATQETVIPTTLQHSWVVEPHAATCTTYGHTYKFCENCAKTETANVTAPYYHHKATCTDKNACLATEIKDDNGNIIKPAGVACGMVNTGRVGTAADCLNNGTIIWACEHGCGYEIEVENAKAAGAGQHNYQPVVNAATCIAKGESYEKCTACGDIINRQELEINPNGHKLVTEEVTTPATCTESGRAITYCELCSFKDADTVLPPLGHATPVEADRQNTDDTAAGYYKYTAPTCSAEGSVTYMCAECDTLVTEKVEIDPEAHNYVVIETVEATCGVAGYIKSECSYCGDEKTTPNGEAKTHNYVDDPIETLSCKTPVVHVTKTCSICKDKQLIETLTADLSLEQYHTTCGAQFDSHFREGDCKKTGIDKYICGTNGATFYVYFEEYGNGHPAANITELGEEFEAYITITSNYKSATCVAKGNYIAWVCDCCGVTGGGEEIGFADHDLEFVPGEDADCVNNGYEAYYKCKFGLCGAIFSDANAENELTAVVTITALGHNYEDTSYDATCTENGQTEETCTRCNHKVITATLNASGHNYVIADKADVDCEVVGYVHYVCTNPVCVRNGEDYGIKEYIDSYKRVLGHDFSETKDCINGDKWVCANNANHNYTEAPRGGHVNADGQALNCSDAATDRVCVECQQTIPVGTHSLVESYVAPTCLAYGYLLRVCTVCQYYEVEEDEIKTLGAHTVPADFTVVTPAGCDTEGLKTKTCPVCQTVVASEKIPALGHSYTEQVSYVAPQICVPGLEVLKCVNGCEGTVSNTIDALDGIKFSYSYDNAIKAGEDFVNTGKIAVTIKFNTKNVTLNSILLALEFDAGVLEYVDTKWDCDSTVFVNCETGYNNETGKVSVSAKVNKIDEANKDVALADGEYALATLYFNVKAAPGYTHAAAQAADLGLTPVMTGDQSASVLTTTTAVAANFGATPEVTLTRLGDVNEDGVVTDKDMVDLLALFIAKGYSAQADINQDGTIDIFDIQLLKQFVIATIDYAELCEGKAE